uniref:G_PROTEIN_RECEP_F1_2 domain-containing protein n=1 Tax=Syphacia muris TaxID=451379 RepID=A0A0N5AZL0_9BILA
MEKYRNECVELNEYLHSFGDLSTEPVTAYIFGLLYTLIIIAGLLGNICVIIAVLKFRFLQTVPNMFIFSLSCSDILVCCFSATITPIAAFEKRWVFGYFLCKSVPFFMGITLCFSTFTLASISVDRFLLIKCPTKQMLTKNKALLIILVTLFSSPVIFKMDTIPICGEFCDEIGWKTSYGRRVYGTILLTVQFVLPFSVIFFCYSSILYTVRKVSNKQKNLEINDDIIKRRQRTNWMLISMVVAFSVSWIGNILYHTLKDYELLPTFILNQEFLYAISVHCIAMTSTVIYCSSYYY